jgi:hypothetical protein
MDLATVQSGMFRGQSRISKYGNARLRRTLWIAGQVAVLKRTNSFRDKFERYIARDRHNAHLRRKAYTAIAAKMARTVYAVVKHGEPYRPFGLVQQAVLSPASQLRQDLRTLGWDHGKTLTVISDGEPALPNLG